MVHNKRDFFKSLSPTGLRQELEQRVGRIILAESMQSLEHVLGGVDQVAEIVSEGPGITRNQFLNLTMYGSLAAVVWAYLSGCAPSRLTAEDIEKYKAIRPQSEIVHYPKLSGQKIQSPEHYGLEGCMIGYWFGKVNARRWIRKVEKMVGHKPSFLYIDYGNSRIPSRGIHYRDPKIDQYSDTVCYHMSSAVEKGVIPFVSYDARYKGSEKQRSKFGNVRDQVISGKHDKAISEVAQIFRRFGDENGGFFIRTMREMNLGKVWPWAGSPKKFKRAWTHIWNIFDGEGANEYATWVWNPYVGNHKLRRYAKLYYPGDKYVDWIGFNGYNWEGQRWRSATRTSISNLFLTAYKEYIGKNKPMMIAETGMDNRSHKPDWVLHAFETTKNKMPGIKGLAWWSERWSSGGIHNFDSRIDSSPESLEVYKKCISDPYFLSTIPYRTKF